MRQLGPIYRAACVIVGGMAFVSCSRSPRAADSADVVVADLQPIPSRVIATWFDAAAVLELRDDWKAFDMVEQEAIARHEAALGDYVDVLALPVVDYGRQVKGREVRPKHSPVWLREQQRRDEPARAARVEAIDRAEGELRRRPPVRRRKWAGPQPVEFLGTPYGSALRQSGPEYGGVLQEVRRMWLAQARGIEVAAAARDAGSYHQAD